MMFADDLVLFGPACTKEAKALRDSLDLYYEWSGQTVNFEKSGVHFSKNVQPQIASNIRGLFHMGNIDREAIYLGMPLFPSRSKNRTYNFTLERISSRIDGWKSKLLSFAGRATLIKSVVSAIPSYAMSSVQLPEALCKKMDQRCVRFGGGTQRKEGCV